MAIKVFGERRGSKLRREFFFKDHFKHTHGISKNTHGHLIWTKFVLFTFLFLIYTKHSLKKPGLGGNVCSPSLVLLLNERSTGN